MDWLPDNLREDWKQAKADAEAARDAVEKSYDPGEWTDEQHEVYARLVDAAREKSKYGQKMTDAEKKALKEYLKNPEYGRAVSRNDLANQQLAEKYSREEKGVRWDDSTHSYRDKYGRECDSRGNTY